MKILIDGQSLQTDSRIRGIGRYTEGLINGLINNGSKVIVLLNGAHEPRCSDAIKSLKNYFPNLKLEIFFPVKNLSSLSIDNLDYFLSQELYLEAVQRIQPDVFICPSVFEVTQSFICPPIEQISKQYPVATVCHDLIPLENIPAYLPSHELQKCYLSLFRSFCSSNLILCNSQFSQNQLLNFLPNATTAVIWGASFSEQVNNFQKKNYVFYCGGLDERKNVHFLCKAYSNLPYHLRSKYPLYICCRKNTHSARELQRYIYLLSSKFNRFGVNFQIKLVEAETNADLARLYTECKLFVFPSKLEGLGLPLIEALTFRAPILSSNAASLPEIINNADALFSPYDEKQLTEKLNRALTNKTILDNLQTYSNVNQQKFSWDKVARIVLDHLGNLIHEKQNNKSNPDNKLSVMELPCDLNRDYLLAKTQQNKRTIYFDVSIYHQTNAHTGIQRVVQKFLQYLPSELKDFNFDICCITGTPDDGYHIIDYRDNSWQILDIAHPVANDWYMSVDLCADQILKHKAVLLSWKNRGVKLFIYIHDIIFNDHPEFVINSKTVTILRDWLEFSVINSDCIMCNSHTVANNVKRWASINNIDISKKYFIPQHLGTDLNLKPLKSHKNSKEFQFISVSTVEPRKGYKSLLTSFIKALDSGAKARLVIVGRRGWKSNEVEDILKNNQYADKQIIWENDCSDEKLKNLYDQSDCFVFASYDEGFGIAIVEAAQFRLPLLLRDIPIFREIATGHALYFNDENLTEYIKSISAKKIELPSINGMNIYSWAQSVHNTAIQLLSIANNELFSYLKNTSNNSYSESILDLQLCSNNEKTDSSIQKELPVQSIDSNHEQSRLFVRKYSNLSRIKFKLLSKIHPSKTKRNHYKDKYNGVPMPEFSTRPSSACRILKYAFGSCFALTKEKRNHYKFKLRKLI